MQSSRSASRSEPLAGLGVEILKLRNSPPPAAYRALLAEADRKGLLVAGHQPNEPVGLAGALAAGQRSIEHIENLGELEKLPAPSRDSVVQGFATFGRFAPESLTAARVAGTTAEPGQATVTEELRAFWRAGMALKPFDPPPEEMRKIADGGLAGMRRLRTAAVKVMAGTDLGGGSSGPIHRTDLAG